MLEEQRRFEAAVLKRYDLQRRPLKPEAVRKLAERLGVDTRQLEANLYSPLDRLSSSWSKVHGDHLRDRMTELGLTYAKAKDLTGVDDSPLYRFVKAQVHPSPESLARILEPLGQTPQEYLALGDQPSVIEGTLFSQALKKFRTDLGISGHEMARRMNLEWSHYSGMERGLFYPTGETAAQLERLAGVTICESKAGSSTSRKNAGPSTPLGTLLGHVRRERGWSRAEAAQKLGVSARRYRKWETQQITAPVNHLLRRIADTTDVSYAEVAWAVFGVEDPTQETFGGRLRRLRRESLLSAKEAALKAGCTSVQWLMYEREEIFPRDENLRKMAKALGVPTSLLRGEGALSSYWLRRTLAENRVTSSDLALVLGEEPETTAGWVQGEGSPRKEQAQSIARFLKAPTSEVRKHTS